jgi:hypothetical protein
MAKNPYEDQDANVGQTLARRESATWRRISLMACVRRAFWVPAWRCSGVDPAQRARDAAAVRGEGTATSDVQSVARALG